MTVPRVFGLPHLSEDAVAAFADGVLSPAAAVRAERHCAECAECAEAVRIQREAAMMLRSAVAPRLPSGLLDRLAGVPMSAPLPPRMSGLPTVLGDDGVPMFVAHKSTPEPGFNAAMRRGILPMGMLASAAAVVAAGALGGQIQSSAGSTEPPTPASITQISAVNLPAASSREGASDTSPAVFGARPLDASHLGLLEGAGPSSTARPHFGAVRGVP